MPLQVFDPSPETDAMPVGSADRRVAEALLADCQAEIQRTRDPGPTLPSGDASPQAVAQAFLDAMRRQLHATLKIKDYEAGVAILNATPSQQAQVVLIAMASLVKGRHSDPRMDGFCRELLKSLLRRKLSYREGEIGQMLKLVRTDALTYITLPVLSILGNVQRHIEQHGMNRSIEDQLTALLKSFDPNGYCSDGRKIGIRIQELLKHAAPACNVAAVDGPRAAQTPSPEASQAFDLQTGEAWTNALLDGLASLPAKSQDHWHQLLDHCRTARASKPTKKWLAGAATILDAIGQGEFMQAIMPALAAIGQAGESQRTNYGGQVQWSEPTEIHDTHADLLRGLVWAAGLFDDADLIGAIGDAAEKCFQKIREVGPRSPKVGNACLQALSSLASESAVAQLQRLKARAKHVSTRKQIAKALERAAEAAGVSEADLVELGVPRFGMAEPGVYQESMGPFTAHVTLHSHRKAHILWVTADGKTQKTVPAAVKADHGEALKTLKKKLKDIDTLLPGIRYRLEALFLTDRSWSLADFRCRYLDHPLVGVLARRLIWNLNVEETTTPVIWQQGCFVDVHNQPLAATSAEVRVSLWHPLQSPSDDVLQWRRWLETHQVTQPFKQAHREIYLLTDAERATAIYSQRFASHIVRQHQLAALCQQRGWRYDLQGDWDGWNAPYYELPQHGLRVEFLVEPLDELNEVTQAFIYTHLSTDQVRFQRLNSDGPFGLEQPVPLDAIPPLVFSEVMRDVDLFVGVTSVGNDPLGPTRHEEAFADYWQKFSFGELSQTAVTRQQTLERILPSLEIAGQCRIEDRFLVVKGQLRTYKIHLGSGNVLMSPDDRYLCIVQKRGSGAQRTDNIFLPFEGDATMSMILSKAFLLAKDDKIKDATIVNQIRLDR